MSLEDIRDIPVPKAKNAVLYLWTTSPKLPEGLVIAGAWGFQYKSSLIWHKDRLGLGYWARNEHEILLVATRGLVHPPEPKVRFRSVYSSKPTKHSEKPPFFRSMIELQHPGTNKLEMFARQTTPGWDVWGNEV